jgi:hypothetical protein
MVSARRHTLPHHYLQAVRRLQALEQSKGNVHSEAVWFVYDCRRTMQMLGGKMKPSWKRAPSWAQWLAMDADGIWYWYEYKPYEGIFMRHCRKGKYQKAGKSKIELKIERRPRKKK